MDLALHVANLTLPGGAPALARSLAATARAADEAGFSDLTLMDHWFQMEVPGHTAEEPMLDGYTTLGFLAGQTERLRLGLLVTGVTYRHPGLLAKTVATLDVLSGGRAMLGIGAAWYEREHHALGVPFPPVAERFERLEETLRICAQMWSEDDGPFEGRHFRLAETLCVPAPIAPGGPPVLIGGMGERKTLRLVARYADATNLFAIGPEGIAHKIEVLSRHCDDVGRDVGSVEKTIITGDDPIADPDAFLASMEAYAAVGVTKVWVSTEAPDLAAWTERVGEQVLPRLREV